MTPVLEDRSALLYRESPGTAYPSLVVLHGCGADARQWDPVIAALSLKPRVVAPQAARSCNPLQGGGNALGDYAGYRWFLELDDGEPEPATFGDSFLQLRYFLEDVVARDGAPAVLGYGQGGKLALALALSSPELFAGVATIHATVPQVPGWTIEPASLTGLPVLLIHDNEQVEDTRRRFGDAGANIQVRKVAVGVNEMAQAVPLLDRFLTDVSATPVEQA